jgi:hypothetical protein
MKTRRCSTKGRKRHEDIRGQYCCRICNAQPYLDSQEIPERFDLMRFDDQSRPSESLAWAIGTAACTIRPALDGVRASWHRKTMRTPRLQPCCSRRSRRVMLGFSCGRAGPSSSRCARSRTLGLRLTARSPSSGSSSGAVTTADRAFLLDRLGGCSPKPSYRDCPSHFREPNSLKAQQHVARS